MNPCDPTVVACTWSEDLEMDGGAVLVSDRPLWPLDQDQEQKASRIQPGHRL